MTEHIEDEPDEAEILWVRQMIEEGLQSGICNEEPEEILAKIMARLPGV